MKKFSLFTFITIIAVIFSCTNIQEKEEIHSNPLPSWNEGNTKQSIINFVEEAINPESQNYIAVQDRIAVFDNDGNLWSEQPAYFQLFFAIDRVKELAPEHPEWKTEQPFKAVLENDMNTLMEYGTHGLLEIVMATHAEMNTEEFQDIVKEWLSKSRHPRFNRPYTELVYQPMLELLSYLRENEFKTFIVSGGGVEFMRAWVEEAYGIPNDQVIGSIIKTEFVLKDGIAMIKRLPEIDFIDDKEGKPIGIHTFIGRRPVFCSGNSDGDLAMMQWTSQGDGANFMLYLHHTDSIREWAYDRQSAIGRLDKGLDEAIEKGWTIIDMENDWKLIYPFELNAP